MTKIMRKLLEGSKGCLLPGVIVLFLFIAIILLNLRVINPDIFWGVFIATLLGFLSSMSLTLWSENRVREQEKGKETEENLQAVRLLKSEMEWNTDVVKKIEEYLNGVLSMSNETFNNRQRDLLFDRLQILSKHTLWKQVVKAISDEKLLEEIAILYGDYLHCNELLVQVSTFVSRNLHPGKIFDDYKKALVMQPWRTQLPNLLQKIIDNGDSIIGKMELSLNPRNKKGYP